MILGTTQIGTPRNMPAGQLYARPIPIPASATAMHLAMVAAYLDGQGPGAALGSAMVSPAVYDADGRLLTVGPGVVIEGGAPGAWRTLRLDRAGAQVADAAWIGLWASGVSNTARMFGATAADAGAVTVPATIEAPAVLVGTTPSTFRVTMFADVFAGQTIPAIADTRLARLPWQMTQRAFISSGPLTATHRTATAGWHGITTDTEQGANAIVRSDGPLADLVGQRLQITHRLGTLRRTIGVYCHDEQAFPAEVAGEDLSLSRRAFLALAPLATDEILVEIEALA